MRLYLESSAIIYYVEEVSPYWKAIEARITIEGLQLGTSDIALIECKSKPLKQQNEKLLEEYDNFFKAISPLVELKRDVIDRTTQIRAHYGFKIPDCLHLAAAVVGGYDAFLTNDVRLRRCTEISVEVIGDIGER